MIVNNYSNLILPFPMCHGFYVELRPILHRSDHWEVRILGDRFGWIDRLENGNYRWTSEEQSAIDFQGLDCAVTSTWVNWCQAFVISCLRGVKYEDPPCPF